MVNKDD